MHQIERDGMAPDTAYVVNPSYMMQISDEALRDHRCDRRGSVALCTYQLGGGRDPSLVELLPAVDIGRLVEFGSANPVVRSFATNGWGNVEPAGRWMLGPEATMILRLPAGSNGLDLHLDIVSFSPPGHLQRVDIQAGSKFLAEWHFDMKNARIPANSAHRTRGFRAQWRGRPPIYAAGCRFAAVVRSRKRP